MAESGGASVVPASGVATSSSVGPLARARRAMGARERLILGVSGVATFLASWEIGARTGVVNTLFFSSPSQVLQAAQTHFGDGSIWVHITTSLAELLTGVALAAVFGTMVGFAGAWFKHAHWIIDPWVTVLYSTPKVALVPLIILVFGIDFTARVFVVGLMALFPIIVNTMIGVENAKGSLLDVARVFGASELMQWKSVVIPASLPFILTGLRLALGHGMIGVVVAELMSGNEGLGWLIKYAAFSLQTATLILGIMLIGIWGMFSGEVMRRVEQRLEAWRPE